MASTKRQSKGSRQSTSTKKKRRYLTQKTLGRGAFGTVYLAKEEGTSNLFAVKETFQDSRYKNREAGILRSVSEHPSIISVHQMFYSQKKDGKYLNIVMEYLPASLHDVIHKHSLQNQRIPELDIAFYSFQLLRACSHLWRLNICHRDIKPQNIVVDPSKRRIRLCDFGSAKQLNDGEWNKHYICSRFYRAPELLSQLNYYSSSVDCWSLGCVIAELYLNRPIFNGHDTRDQLRRIAKVLGPVPFAKYPDTSQPIDTDYKLPAKRWQKVLAVNYKRCSLDAADLVSNLLCYVPEQRFDLKNLHCLKHPFIVRFKDGHSPKGFEAIRFLEGEQELID